MRGKINILCGMTACGKTKHAIGIANRINAEVINADSMQVYQEIPIITAQPTTQEMQGIPHHLYGIASCTKNITVAEWVTLATLKIKEIQSRGKTPLLVGGTGMYVKSLIEGLSEIPKIPEEVKSQVRLMDTGLMYKLLSEKDSKAAATLKPNDRQRVGRALEVVLFTHKSILEWQKQPMSKPFAREDYYLMLLSRPREVVYANINQRFLGMLEHGALEEVRSLYETHGDINFPKAHGLPELIKYIKGELSLQEAISQTQQKSRNYAKRQITWFKHQIDFDMVIEQA